MSDYGCLKNIPWETRNLGRPSFAVEEEKLSKLTDTFLASSLATIEKQFGKIFVQARVDKLNFSVLPIIQRNKFYFIETVLVPYIVFRKNPVFEKFCENKEEFIPSRMKSGQLSFVQLDKDNPIFVETVKSIAAESFSDDRFHLDPYCTEAMANQRFSYWVDDLLGNDSVIFDLLMNGDVCTGFMARKENNLILAGFAKKYIGSGLGDFLWLSSLYQIYSMGFANCHTLISSNNTAVLNLYGRLGFKFKDPAVTFHYWSEK